MPASEPMVTCCRQAAQSSRKNKCYSGSPKSRVQLRDLMASHLNLKFKSKASMSSLEGKLFTGSHAIISLEDYKSFSFKKLNTFSVRHEMISVLSNPYLKYKTV